MGDTNSSAKFEEKRQKSSLVSSLQYAQETDSRLDMRIFVEYTDFNCIYCEL